MSDPLQGDLATMLSYEQHVRENNDNATTGVYSSFVGDACDGTAYSDRTDPKCVEMFELLQYFHFNSLVLGNHDIAYNDTFDYLLDKMRGDSSWFKDQSGQNNFISTNVFYLASGQNFTEMMKLETLQNGLRVLTISFCIWDFDQYNITEVYDAATMFGNPVFLKDLENKAADADVVVLANHIGTENAQNYETITRVRQYFEDNFNYQVPIILLTAHTNQLVKKRCAFTLQDTNGATESVEVENCYTTESGYYGQQLYHVNYTFSETEYTNRRGERRTGYKLVDVGAYASDLTRLTNVLQNGTDEGFLARFS